MGLHVVLLGPPGAGKGTQAAILAKRYGIPHISTGDMLRDSAKGRTQEGRKAKAFMEKGELVPDGLVIALVKRRLARADAKKGFLLDGFPRTEEQARSLDAALQEIDKALDAALYFKTRTAVILKRLTGRWICEQCGRIYNVPNAPPKKKGRCDRCGRELVQRADDKKETILRRLGVYEAQTASLIDYYRQSGILSEVNGDEAAQRLTPEIDAIFGEATFPSR